ncbi:hypothetical protein [Caniella muris]|uniref:hypothetical protein n=1 Tax=Caniella muris TaxID=2941502 RepID=UPI00203D1970|nr:hypothetical protein [Caniella muris]
MSCKGSIVIRDNGETRYFSTGAYNPLSYLFLSQEKLKEKAQYGRLEFQKLNSAWDETGVLMDADERQLLYFGGECAWEIGFRKVLNAFLEHTLWPGWKVRFCPKGIVDFAQALDMGPLAMPWLDGTPPDLYDLRYWIADESSIDSPDMGEIESLLMIRVGGERCLHGIRSMYVCDILDHGEDLIAPLSKRGFRRYVSGIDGDGLCSSALIDCDEKRLTYWYVDEERPPEYFARFWPGWEIVDLADDYRSFSLASGGAVMFDESLDMDRAIAGIRACNHDIDISDKPLIPEEELEALLSSFLAEYR